MASQSVRFDDDSTCMCTHRPIFNDSVYGRDELSLKTIFRKREIEEEIQHYRLVLPTSISLSERENRFTILRTAANPNSSCSDSFYAHLTGPVLQELRFYALTDTASSDNRLCVYGCIWEPFFPGKYEVNVWLTYTNGSGLSEPSLLQPFLNASRAKLVSELGRIKDIGFRASSFETDPKFRYGIASKVLSSQQFDVHDLHQGAKRVLEEEDFCSEQDTSSTSGFFVRRDICLSDPNCRRILPSSKGFHDNLKYIWKPTGCISPIFGSAEEFAEALHWPRISTFRLLFVGDSLQAEESCAMKHFLAGKDFAELDCSKAYREGNVPAIVNIKVDFLSIPGFYSSFYGWSHALPNRTLDSIGQVLRYAETSHPDLLIWNDGVHSLEKNDVAEVVSEVEETAQQFQSLLGDRVMFRMVPYVHSIGPSMLVMPNAGFYETSMLLQAPRIELANQRMRHLMMQYGIPTYDSSVVHAARPEGTRDNMHWSRVRNNHSPPTAEQCRAYCDGKWMGVAGFSSERDAPTMIFSSMQLMLGAVVHHQRRKSACRTVPVLDLSDTKLALTQEDIVGYRDVILDPNKWLMRGLASDCITEISAMLALRHSLWCFNSSTAAAFSQEHINSEHLASLVLFPLSEVTRVASSSEYFARESSFVLPLSSRLGSSNNASRALLEHLEETLNRSLASSARSVAIVATHGLQSELPVHRALLSSLVLEKRRHAIVTTEIRIRTRSAFGESKITRGTLVPTNSSSGVILMDEVAVGDVLFGRRQPLPSYFLDSFVIIPYFTSASCADSVAPFWKRREPRPLTFAFVGCVPRPQFVHGAGFEARRLLLHNLVDDKAQLINSCDLNNAHDQRHKIWANDARALYSRSDFCFAISGESISSSRLFDILSALCIPIITDQVAMLPFPSEIPWQKFVFHHEIRSATDIEEIKRRVACISFAERVAMREEMSRHVHKVLWNWEGGSQPCPAWMRTGEHESSPGALLTKIVASGSNRNVLVSDLKVQLKPSC
eukprot:gene28416-34307_t